MEPRTVLTAFDIFLAERGLRFEAVVIGGTALNLLGVVRRTTRDCDVLHPEIPASILQAAKVFAIERSGQGDALQEQDGNPEWPAHVIEVLDDLRGRLGYGL